MRTMRFLVPVVVAVAMLAPVAAAQTNDPFPYLTKVEIGPRPDLTPEIRPLCPDDSIWVRVTGQFPDACFKVLGVELVPSPIVGPLPEPPFVVIHVERTCGGGCATVITPFHVEAILPPLPARDYTLFVQLGVQCVEGNIDPRFPFYEVQAPFVVQRCDSSGGRCVWGDWVHPNATLCDADIGPGHNAEVTFTVQSDIALAGLQGNFRVHPVLSRTSVPPPVIERIVPIGPAAGMHLNWTRTPDGARFVVFADEGAPIPPAGVITGLPPVPILRVVLRPGGDVVPAMTYVTADGLLGSDENGGAVPMCRIETLAIVAARVCGDPGCDFNRDGRTDVRDLVLMARCISDETHCDMTRFHDCNGDGGSTLADVICCARRMLGNSTCAGCLPDTVNAMPAPDVKVRLGEARLHPDGADVPLDLEGFGGIGGALVSLRYPSDRYEAAIEFGGGDAEWLRLDDTGDGEAAIGLLRLSPGGASDVGPVTLHLTLKSGQSHGGEVTVAGGEFSGMDGEPLEVTLDAGALTLGGPGRVALSEGRPNPFTGETRFTLTLDRAASATVRVHDLSGRMVATLYAGPLSAGEHAFVWRGNAADGSSAPSGIYFVRVVSGGVNATRKLVRLRD